MRTVSYLHTYELPSLHIVTRERLSSSRVLFSKEVRCCFQNVAQLPLPVPSSPERYMQHHPDRIKAFPSKGRLLVESASPDSVDRQWRHELDHDAESVFWLLYWVVGAQPAEREKEGIIPGIWANLTGPVRLRTGLLRSLIEEESLEEVTHSAFRPLLPLLSNLATFLVVDRHWLDKTEVRSNEQYIPEAFQRLILQFILDNQSEEFMTQPVDRQFRQVQVISQSLSLPGTGNSRWNAENSRKRPSPRPSMQRIKRPRLAEGVAEVR